ncbi:hypothetical protein CBL_00425 [Carabus blaptoides fortunei]
MTQGSTNTSWKSYGRCQVKDSITYLDSGQRIRNEETLRKLIYFLVSLMRTTNSKIFIELPKNHPWRTVRNRTEQTTFVDDIKPTHKHTRVPTVRPHFTHNARYSPVQFCQPAW